MVELKAVVPRSLCKRIVGRQGGNSKFLEQEYAVRVKIDPWRDSSSAYDKLSNTIVIFSGDFRDVVKACLASDQKTESAVIYDGTLYGLKIALPEIFFQENDISELQRISLENSNVTCGTRNLPDSDEKCLTIESDSKYVIKKILQKIFDFPLPPLHSWTMVRF